MQMLAVLQCQVQENCDKNDYNSITQIALRTDFS